MLSGKLEEAWPASQDEMRPVISSQLAHLQQQLLVIFRGERSLTNDGKAQLVSSPPACESQKPCSAHAAPETADTFAKEEFAPRPALRTPHNEKELLQDGAESPCQPQQPRLLSSLLPPSPLPNLV